MEWWATNLGAGGDFGIGVGAVVAICWIVTVLIAVVGTKLRYGGVLNKVGRSAFFWSVIGCDVGPTRYHKSSLIYWRVGRWCVAGRPDLLLRHRFLPIVEVLEVKSRLKSRPSPYEFLQVQVYLAAVGQSFPWLFRKAYLVYPSRQVEVRRSRRGVRFLKRVLSDVSLHLARGLSFRDRRALETLVADATH